MTLIGRKEPFILLLGDIFIFVASLWLTLLVRYFEVPDEEIWNLHAAPFSLIFIVWILVFNIAGLYRKHTVLLKRKLPTIILYSQLVNVVLAALFFFAIPIFGITPKTNLVIYLVISVPLIVLWRLVLYPKVDRRKKRNAVIIGSGGEIEELKEEINNNTKYDLFFVATLNLDGVTNENIVEEVEQVVKENSVSVIAIDATDERVVPILPTLYSLLFLGIQIVDISRVYEDIFERVPLSFVKQNWLLDNVSITSRILYQGIKRILDFIIAIFLSIPTLVTLPFVALAIKLDDGGPLFYFHERVGKNGKIFRIAKYRTMTHDGSEVITRVGAFLRKSYIDELPQLLSVLKGDLSLVGPRPEMPHYTSLYERRIPYYNIRHLVTPGLSGWAQIHQDTPPKYGVQYDQTAMKLSYDLYYVKNRNIFFDIQIGLRTVLILISRTGH